MVKKRNWYILELTRQTFLWDTLFKYLIEDNLKKKFKYTTKICVRVFVAYINKKLLNQFWRAFQRLFLGIPEKLKKQFEPLSKIYKKKT